MITKPIEWIKQNGSIENFRPNHVLIVLPDELDILFCHDLESCCYGPESDDTISFYGEKDDDQNPTIIMKGIFDFLKNYDREKLWNKKEAICYAQDLRNALDDSYDVWCSSGLDLMHANIHEKRPFRMKKQTLEISEVYRGGSDFCIGAVKAVDREKTIIAWYKENCICSDDMIGIEEDTVFDYLFPFLDSHFDGTMKENANRINYPDGTWDWYGDNFFTFGQMENVILEIRDVIKLLKEDFDSPALDKYRKNFANIALHDKEWKYGISDDEKNKIAKRHKDDLIDFYELFIAYMERFMQNGEKDGLNLIAFTGP